MVIEIGPELAKVISQIGSFVFTIAGVALIYLMIKRLG